MRIAVVAVGQREEAEWIKCVIQLLASLVSLVASLLTVWKKEKTSAESQLLRGVYHV